MHADAHRQVGGELVDACVQGFTECLNVAALLHRNRQADGRLAVEAEFRSRRIDVTATDLGDVGQTIKAVIEFEIDLGQILLRGELPRGTHRNSLRPGFNDPGRRHRVLRLQALHHLTLVDAQRRQFAGGEVQVDHFILLADHLDLAQPRHIADLGARLFHIVAQLPHRQAVGGERIDRTEYITELVVESRPLNPLGKLAANIVDLLAYQISGMSLALVVSRRYT